MNGSPASVQEKKKKLIRKRCRYDFFYLRTSRRGTPCFRTKNDAIKTSAARMWADEPIRLHRRIVIGELDQRVNLKPPPEWTLNLGCRFSRRVFRKARNSLSAALFNKKKNRIRSSHSWRTKERWIRKHAWPSRFMADDRFFKKYRKQKNNRVSVDSKTSGHTKKRRYGHCGIRGLNSWTNRKFAKSEQ